MDMIVRDLAKAIEQSGRTRYRIAKDTGIDQGSLCRLVHGGRCSMAMAERLCEYLGLALRPVKRARSK